MQIRLHNFGAGPCILPQEVLVEAAEAIRYWAPASLSLLEVSHRHPAFEAVMHETRQLVRELLGVPGDYHILFLQGGASGQFGMVPQNFLQGRHSAAFLDTGFFSLKAMRDAAIYGDAEAVASSAHRAYRYVPTDYTIPETAAYFHITSNNTIEGTQMQVIPDSPVPLFCDMSSDIFSKAFDISRFSLIYAGAQKNMGPAGMTLVILKKSLLEGQRPLLPNTMDYLVHAEHSSLYHTAPVFAIYTAMLNLRWLKAKGGVAVQEAENKFKAARLYETLDRNRLFKPFADRGSRSLMNVTFHLPDAALEAAFLGLAEKQQIAAIRGFKTMGGFRASLYNAPPLSSVEVLCSAIEEFAHEQRYL
jgi:phosphoserine aminotransferase